MAHFMPALRYPFMTPSFCSSLICIAFALTAAPVLTAAEGAHPVPGDGASIQRALDAKPGGPVFVPPGDYPISTPIKITGPNGGLWGPGRIIQSDPNAAVIEAINAPGVQVRGVTLTRADGRQESTKGALLLTKCVEAVVADVQVLDNWANANAISLNQCPRSVVRGCLVRNYSRIAVDDRTKTSFLGYAFRCIDGTGISVNSSIGVMVANNRIIERRMLPTPELKAKYSLGKFTKKNAKRGWHISQEMWDSEYFNGWHQGAALVINNGETGDCIHILGNYIENAAQGIDVHADHVIMANNVINNAFIGMKAVHGSRNVLIVANQFSRNDLWSIGLMPGSASHPAGRPTELSGGQKSSLAANNDGESIIANNIISDFGYGMAHWNWLTDKGGMAPIRLGAPEFGEQGKLPERDVIVTGNVIYDPGHDQVLVDGKPQVQPPRYKFAVKFAAGPNRPENILFADNLFNRGTEGVMNAPGAK